MRHKGRIFTAEEAAALGEKQWSDVEDNRYGLPADIGLSVEDALRVWAERPGASAMRRP